MRCRIITSWGIHIDWVFSSSYCIGCYHHCFCIRDDGPDQPGSLSTETPCVLKKKFSLKDGLLGMMEMAWVGRGDNLW